MKKRILKRIGFSLVILSSLLLGTACLNPSNAQDFLFYKSTEHIGMGYISNFGSPIIFDFENEKYRFERDAQGILHLKSVDGKIDYLSFIPTFISDDGDINPNYYHVRKIYTSNPDLQFLEIQVNQGIWAEGYWLIGKWNNKWITYVFYDSLNNLLNSIELPAAVEIESKVNSDRSGKMTLNINDYDFTKMQNILIELYWDDISNQIKMKQYKI